MAENPVAVCFEDWPRPLLVTGANGFVGRHLCHYLSTRELPVRRAVRALAQADGEEWGRGGAIQVGDIGPHTDWRPAVAGVEGVVHLAARVHHPRDRAGMEAYRAVNVAGTEGLARAAAAAGVRRLVFLSSVKAQVGQGAMSSHVPFSDPYALSKWEAEQRLWEVAAATGLEVVVVRPPLVYGPGVGANFVRLLRLVERGLPLPLAAVRNRRSLVFVGNLVDFLSRCLTHPGAAGRTFAVSDGHDLSTPELVGKIAAALGRKPRLWPCPVALLRAVATVCGRSAEIDRLCGSLRVECGAVSTLLDWQPPFSVEEGLAATVAWFRAARLDERTAGRR